MKDLEPALLREGLTRKYQICLELYKNKNFDYVVSLHDYMDYINKHPVLDYLFTEKVQKEARDSIEKIKKHEVEAEKDIDAVFNEIRKRISKKKALRIIMDKRVIGFMEEYSGFSGGKITSSLGRVNSLHRVLENLITHLHSLDPKIVSDYILLNQEYEGQIEVKNSVISTYFASYARFRDLFQRKSQTTAWGLPLTTMTESCKS